MNDEEEWAPPRWLMAILIFLGIFGKEALKSSMKAMKTRKEDNPIG